MRQAGERFAARSASLKPTGTMTSLFLVGRLDLGCRDRLLQMRHPRGAAPGGQQHRLVRIWPL
jgi:hypothetical protein